MKTSVLVSEVIRATSIKAVNQLLGLGWELIGTHTELLGNIDTKVEGDEFTVFILGWPRESGAPKKPRDLDTEETDIDVP